MAKNEEIVEQQERENAAVADRVNYTHRLVGMHEAAPPVQVPAGRAPDAPPQSPPQPVDQADGHAAAAAPAAEAQARAGAGDDAEPSAAATAPAGEPADEAPLRCPHCGATNPAAMNRSDGRQCYRCDRCAWQWGAPHEDTAEDDVPPIPSIDAPGG